MDYPFELNLSTYAASEHVHHHYQLFAVCLHRGTELRLQAGLARCPAPFLRALHSQPTHRPHAPAAQENVNYPGARALYDKYSSTGQFNVVAFSCNQFGGQAPLSSQEEREFAWTMVGGRAGGRVRGGWKDDCKLS